ncbi:MAG: 4Fe-4S binding protein [Elusimicrobia bacterium]|nr:4Fe-4S binding protein [Elusimicrobiota bacterium]
MNKVKRKIIKIDEDKCNGCKLCIPSCPEGALQIVDTPKGRKARLVKENFCDGLGACLGDCPQGALSVVEAEAEGYDEEGVIAHIKENTPEKLEQHMKHLKEHADELPQHHSHHSFGMSGCPGSKATSWETKPGTLNSGLRTQVSSELRQWPVQLTLVNPQAAYFSRPGGTDLLIAADCVPFAYAKFHQDFLKDKALVIACPKLDDAEFYKEKLTEIFKSADIKSITVVNMEVPCCFGLQHLVKEAIVNSGKKIPYNEIVTSIKGEIIKEE